MRLFPITSISFPFIARAGKNTASFFVFAFLLSALAVGSLSAAGPQATGTGSDEDEHTYPDPPPARAVWNSVSLAADYYGGLHASGIGFEYWNNYMMMEDLIEHLRNVPLVTYNGDEMSGSSSLVPPAGGGYAAPYQGGYGYVNPNQVGGYQYSTGGYQTAPYGPGYAPGYEQGQPGYQMGYPVYQDGIMTNPQGYPVNTAPPLYRGQAQYGDPGTLIYSLWGGVVGGGGTIKDHVDVTGYKTKQFGGFVGLDLFGSCDCRSGLFYAYQKGELKEENKAYDYLYAESGTLFDPVSIVGEGEEEQYSTAYDYTSNFAGRYDGKLKAHNHLIGLYHQFGSEFIYNIFTARFGFNRIKTKSDLSETGTTTGTVTETLSKFTDGELVEEFSTVEEATNPDGNSYSMDGKYNEYLGGVSLERGANLKFLNFLTFAPRGSLDYTYMFRSKINENVEGFGVNTYKKKSYHSLRSQLGGDLAVDLYPGDGHLRLLARGGWIHEFLNYHYGKTSLTDLYGSVWTIQGNSTGRDWAVVGAGGEWAIVPSFMIFANYDFYKNKYLSSHYGDVGLKLMW